MVHLTNNPLGHFFKKHKEQFLKHKDKFIWMHSIYALFFGIGVMWLGSQDFKYIRIAIWEITFIWLSSLAIPLILSHPKIPLKWKQRIRLSINYFNRNFYQQLLFFVLPIYYMSATAGSKNIFFIVLIAISAIFSTMDIVYDRYISVRGTIMSLFFAFNLFAGINAMLPILWGVRTIHAVRISAIIAFLGFVTFCFQLTHIKTTKKWLLTMAAGLVIFMVAELGRSFIPPAPLRVDAIDFGTSMVKNQLKIYPTINSLPVAKKKQRIYILSAIKANITLKERVRHLWYLNGEKLFTSRLFHVIGRAGNGFRVWTAYSLPPLKQDSLLMVEVQTEGGQLVGRRVLKAESKIN